MMVAGSADELAALALERAITQTRGQYGFPDIEVRYPGALLHGFLLSDAVALLAELRVRAASADQLRTLIAQQLTPLDVAITHVQILRRKGDDYGLVERDNVAAIVEQHVTEARKALFAALSAGSGTPGDAA